MLPFLEHILIQVEGSEITWGISCNKRDPSRHSYQTLEVAGAPGELGEFAYGGGAGDGKLILVEKIDTAQKNGCLNRQLRVFIAMLLTVQHQHESSRLGTKRVSLVTLLWGGSVCAHARRPMGKHHRTES